MGLLAEVVVLFDAREAAAQAVTCEPILSPIDDADYHCWVSPEGELEFGWWIRSSPLMGEESLSGRVWRADLGRYRFGESTIPPEHCRVLRRLLAALGVRYVWYGVLTQDTGCRDVAAVTPAWLSDRCPLS